MGMLVDNAIVVTDNAQIAIARGVNRRKALIDGATGPQWGLLGATFIAIVFLLTTLSGTFGSSRNCETALYRIGHFTGIKLGVGFDANNHFR